MHNWKGAAVFLAFSATAVATGSATENTRIGSATINQLQSIVNDAARAAGAEGAQVSVVVDGQRADFVYGTANAELNTPMTVDTVVQLGSTTKLFNAAIVMSLVDEGKLALDSPITQYIPDFRAGGEPAPKNITLRRLLSMSAGIDFGPYQGFNGDDAIGRYVAALGHVPLSYPPGQGFGYSNAGAAIAGRAAEVVTGLPWDTLLKKRVFEPAGLTQAANLASDLAYVRVAVGHTNVHSGQSGVVLRPWDTTASLNPAGAGVTIAMSAHDLATFGQLFLNGGKPANGKRVLSEAAVKAMMTPTTHVVMAVPHWGAGSEWGLGPSMAKWGDTVVWGHGGSARGGCSILLWFPDKRAVLAFTENSPTTFDSFALRITGDFAQTLLGVRAPAPALPKPPLRVAHPEHLIGTYARAGVRIEITAQDGLLRYQEFNEELSQNYREAGQKVPLVEGTPIVSEQLTALGGDRFLLKFPGFEPGIGVFFFGKDAQGRATNVNSGLRTSRRVE